MSTPRARSPGNARMADALAILDDGVAIYRGNVARYLIITLIWIVPFALAILLIVAIADNGWLAFVLGVVTLMLMIPALNMWVIMLARATRMAVAGEPIRIRATFGMPAPRALGMGCFTVLYMLVIQLIASAFSTLFFCIVWIAGLSAIGIFANVGGAFAGLSAAVTLGGSYTLSAAISGAAAAALFHALQPWALEDIPGGQLFGRGVDTTTHRIGYNLIVWLLTGTVYAIMIAIAMVSIGIFAVIPLVDTLSTSLLNQAIVAVAWLIGFILVVPLMPIWMTLLYTRKHNARAGGDLGLRVARWRATLDQPGPP